MDLSIFCVAANRWRKRINMLKNFGLLMMVVTVFGQADAQLLTETPQPKGGEIVGSWTAEKTALRAYVPAALVAAVHPLTFEGETNGTLTFGSDGAVQADYMTASTISAVLLIPLTVSVPDTSHYEANYTLVADTHELVIARENADTLRYTYTATADSLYIMRPLLLDELLASLDESVRGLASSVLAQFVSEDDPIKIVLSFAKATGSETPTVNADFDGSGTVDFQDFLAFVGVFGKRPSDEGWDARMDLNGDNEVNFDDFLRFVAAFGSTSG